ncbi:MAG: Rrf2 family transcriptional regulator [Phycisphaerales bacterium]|nr:Rrf2 family transcriptional regulator [Phycisphaerales bacterium]
MYGSQTETAIAAMSRLAEVFDGGKTLLSASDIAKARGLQPPFVAKILTALSQAGLVTGARGPGGGYTLAKPPEQITLRDVFVLFERENNDRRCFFGGRICGVDPPCVLHEKLVRINEAVDDLISGTTFDAFREQARTTAQTDSPGAPPPGRRRSFRATQPRRHTN